MFWWRRCKLEDDHFYDTEQKKHTNIVNLDLQCPPNLIGLIKYTLSAGISMTARPLVEQASYQASMNA